MPLALLLVAAFFVWLDTPGGKQFLGVVGIIIFIAIIIFALKIIKSIIIDPISRAAEKQREESRKRQEELRRQEEEARRRQEAMQRDIESSKSYLQNLLGSSKNLVISMPTLIKEAEQHLDIAEEEFSDGVFAPFWDQIENATNKLAAYHQNINKLNYTANEYRQRASTLPVKVPSFSLPTSLPDARPTATRLAKIVRKAQKNFHFSTIYEQRKTNKLLYEGFRSLGDAIYSLGNEISSSLQDLSDRLHVSLNDLLDASHEQTHALSQHNEDMKRHVDNLKDLASQDSAARRRFEQKSLNKQKEQNEILDNIQRGRKPPPWGT